MKKWKEGRKETGWKKEWKEAGWWRCEDMVREGKGLEEKSTGNRKRIRIEDEKKDGNWINGGIKGRRKEGPESGEVAKSNWTGNEGRKDADKRQRARNDGRKKERKDGGRKADRMDGGKEGSVKEKE